MAVLTALFASGHAVDLVLLVIAAEFVFLTLRRGRRLDQRRDLWLDRVLALMPGVCLLIGLRLALTGAGWPLIALALAASFPFHIADLVRRRL